MTKQRIVQKPVIVRYARDVEPTPEHPTGFLAGQGFVSASPEIAANHHPHGTIIRYEDGSAYPQHEAVPPAPSAPKSVTAPKGSSKADSPARRRGRG